MPKQPTTIRDVPYLVDRITNGEGWERISSIRSIYLLSDVDNKQNRVPLVHSGEYDVLPTLARCLSTEASGDALRLTCLALNNLSVADENKCVMVRGQFSLDILDGLCKIISENKQECYLACICLMNLSMKSDLIISILRHAPSSPDDGGLLAPLENPRSLIRILERLLLINVGSVQANCTLSGKAQRQSECVRWACGLIQNLSQCEENATLITKTTIPKSIVKSLQSIPTSNLLVRGEWAPTSLQAFAFGTLRNLAQWSENAHNDALLEAGAMKFIQTA